MTLQEVQIQKGAYPNVIRTLLIINNEYNSGYYTYVDYTADVNIPFYVGKGTLNRCKHFFRNMKRRGKHDRIILKHGCIRIAIETPDELSSLELEKLLISKLCTFYFDKTLTGEQQKWASNFTQGGDGVSGMKFSLESRKLIGEKSKGNIPWNTGKKVIFTDEHKHNMALARIGKKHSPETCKKISDKRKGKPANNKGISMSLQSKLKLSQSCKNNPKRMGINNPMSKQNRVIRLGNILLSFYEPHSLWNN